MKKMLCMLSALSLVVFSSCGDVSLENENKAVISEEADYGENSTNIANSETVNYVLGSASYRPYSTARELTENADTVIVGKVTGISFTVIDIATGLLPAEDSVDVNRWLCTIYDVDILTTYKGEVLDTVQIRFEGGKKDYRVEEQLEVMREHRVVSEDTILLMTGIPEIEIGETYLFALREYREFGEGILPITLTPQQSIYNLSNPFSRVGYSDARLSAKDVISAFGEEKWEEFWTEWQRDNPDWESRLDKAAVERALAER